jgi:hypothetical protein
MQLHLVKGITDDRTTDAEETIIDTRPPVDYAARIREQQQKENAGRAALEAVRPAWAKALIVAELEHDASDSMTDYFNTTTSRIVALAWSSHTRDLFAEMRKAAATFPETAHLGPNRDVYRARVVLTDDVISNGSAYWKGSPSHWHRELYASDTARDHGETFSTRAEADAFIAAAGQPEPIIFNGSTPKEKLVRFEWRIDRESIEHREKYSMGHGFYLKASGRYSSGWIIRKVDPRHVSGVIEHERLTARRRAPEPPTMSPIVTPGTVAVTLNSERQGIEISFPAKPAPAILETLKAAGWRWSRFAGCWYQRDTPEARAFAERFTRQV